MQNKLLQKILVFALLATTAHAYAYASYVVMDDDSPPSAGLPYAGLQQKAIQSANPSPFPKTVIRFGRNSAQLMKSEKTKLVNLAASVQGSAEVKILVRNDSPKNDKLGDKRALALRNLLVAQGIKPSAITTVVDDEQLSNKDFPSSEILVIFPFQKVAAAAPAPITQQPTALTSKIAAKKVELANLVANGIITPAQSNAILERTIEAALTSDFAKSANANASGENFEIRESDGTLQATLNRWAASAGWKISWKGVAPIRNPKGTIPINENYFIDAADRVLQSANAALGRKNGVQLVVAAYSNNVLVVTQK